VIPDGNIVFDHGFNIGSGGTLTINANNNPEGRVFVRDGGVSKSGQGSFIGNNMTMYLSEKVDSFQLTGGSGALTWIAPNTGDFDDLALWSDTAVLHNWAGQANVNLEGVFFTPLADVEYSGNGAQTQANAQFVANRLLATGNGSLTIAPTYGRAVKFPIEPESVLIR